LTSGDDSAFTALFNHYWNHLYSVAFVLTKSEAFAEDVVQEIFLKIWHRRMELNKIERFENYLFILTRNYIFSEFKKLKTRREYLVELKRYFTQQHESPEDEYVKKESALLLEGAVSSLPPQQQQVYRLSREAGLTHEAIAGQLGISMHTVRNHIIKAMKGIRQYVNRHDNALIVLLALIKSGF
jgi:RNA polymerase sigma-70 factor (family 1)